MKRIVLLLVLLLAIHCLNAQPDRKITILHTNDLHSRLLGFSPESEYSPLTVNDDKTVGGFSRIASIIKTAEQGNAGATLVLDAGDFMMGTLFPSLEKESGFQLRLMKEMGYDVVAVGNHEFEFGPEWLSSVINVSSKNGPIPSVLIGNAIFDMKDIRDDALEKELSDKLITRKIVITRGGIRIGIFSLLGKTAAGLAPKARPVTFDNQARFAREMVKELKSEKCELIICLSHSGITKDRNGVWAGEDVELARSVKGLDLIISGHTHTKLIQPLIVEGVPIVQTGEFGQYVGCMTLSLSKNKAVIDDYKLIPVDDKILGDEKIERLIQAQKERVNTEILNPLGMEYDKPVTVSSFGLSGNDVEGYETSNLGPFIADAIQYYVNKNTTSGTDVSMVAAGMFFDKIVPGKLSASDIFRIMPLGSGNDGIPGYALSRLYVTGKELKSILEILQVVYKSTPDEYCYYSGIRVDFDPSKGIFRKIKRIQLVHADGSMKEVDFSKKNKTLHSITADSYMLEFIGIIKKKSFGLINVIPKDASGNRVSDMAKAVIDMNEKEEGIQEGKEWLALISYLGSMHDTNGDGVPDMDPKYSSPVKCFFTLNH